MVHSFLSTTHIETKRNTTLHFHNRISTIWLTVSSPPSLQLLISDVHMLTTAKHHVTGTMKHTVPYKNFCNFFHELGDGYYIYFKKNKYILSFFKDYIMYKFKKRIKGKYSLY